MKRFASLLLSGALFCAFAAVAHADDDDHEWRHHRHCRHRHVYVHFGLYGPWVGGPYVYAPGIVPYYPPAGTYVYRYGYYGPYSYRSHVRYYRYGPRVRVRTYYYSPSWYGYYRPYGYSWGYFGGYGAVRIRTPRVQIRIGF